MSSHVHLSEIPARSGQGKGRSVRPLHLRFWEKVQKGGADECWPWAGALRKGYGAFCLGGEDGSIVQAHRVSWELHGNVLPVHPLVLDHACKNKACVNPAHLRIVTQEDNCTVLAPPTPFTINASKTHCPRGHEYTPENTAHPKRRDGRIGRMCLVCYPTYWRWAVIPRARPAGSRIKPGDPEYQQGTKS